MPSVANLVRVTSATTGTGTLTLGSVISGFLTPSQAGMVDGLTYDYVIEADFVAVGDDSVPTSREVGSGTYTASGTTLSRTVLKSTNSNALLNLAGDAQVFITVTTGTIREKLSAARNYYVRSDGNDSNNGLANTSGGAFLTIQKAYDVIAQTVDIGGQVITINVGSGTFVGARLASPMSGGGSIVLLGAGSGSTTVNADETLGQAAFQTDTGSDQLTAFFFGSVTLADPTASGYAVIAISSALTIASFDADLAIGASSNGDQIILAWPGAAANFGSYKITGGATAGNHIHLAGGGCRFRSIGTCTLSGTPGYVYFAFVEAPAEYKPKGTTFSGSATGTRYNVQLNGVIQTGGGGANFLPGNAAGSASLGGQYN